VNGQDPCSVWARRSIKSLATAVVVLLAFHALVIEFGLVWWLGRTSFFVRFGGLVSLIVFVGYRGRRFVGWPFTHWSLSMVWFGGLAVRRSSFVLVAWSL